jgi:hypothetical protein
MAIPSLVASIPYFRSRLSYGMTYQIVIKGIWYTSLQTLTPVLNVWDGTVHDGLVDSYILLHTQCHRLQTLLEHTMPELLDI